MLKNFTATFCVCEIKSSVVKTYAPVNEKL